MSIQTVKYRNREFPLYTEKGWVNIPEIFEKVTSPYLIMIGARGIGKTYGIFDYFISKNIPFMYLRLTNKQAKYAVTEGLSDLLKYMEDAALDYAVNTVADNVYDVTAGECEGLVRVTSLYMIGSVRGLNAAKYQWVFLDEFIAEPGQIVKKDIDVMLLNAMETLGRNRELTGDNPLRLVMASNSNQIQSGVLAGLGLIDEIVEGRKKGKQLIDLSDRGMAVLDFVNSPISERKRNTTLYQAATNRRFVDMALGNLFEDYDDSGVLSRNLKNYDPVWSYEDRFTFYRAKSDGTLYYVSRHRKGTPPIFNRHRENLKRVMLKYWYAYLSGKVEFESYEVKINFTSIFTNNLR